MNIIAQSGRDDLATVFVAELGDNRYIEFVESHEPPIPMDKKWVSIISTLYGCPSQCLFCDAGLDYLGKLGAAEIMAQIDYLVSRRFPSKNIPVEKWKIQFARMGDPAFNPAVLDVLEQLPIIYDAPGLMPSISTIAPSGTDNFFDRMLGIKHRLFPLNFQFQFSLHSTDESTRHHLIPVKTWDMKRMSEYGRALHVYGGRKVAINFAMIEGVPIDPEILSTNFDPAIFILKFTPLNPTNRVVANSLVATNIHSAQATGLFQELRFRGFEVIVSIGELEENAIGSNCGQYVSSLSGPLNKARAMPHVTRCA